MRRAILAASVLTLLDALSLPVGAQSLPSKQEATERLKKVFRGVDLQDAHTPPFHLVASVRYELQNKSYKATYELFWAAPDQFRRNFSLGGSVETDIALIDKLSIERNTPMMMLPLWSLNALINSPMAFLGADPRVKKVYSVPASGGTQTCVDSNRDFWSNHTCFAADTDQIISAKADDVYHKGPPRYSLDDFADLGPRRFPRHIVRNHGLEILEVRLETFELVKAFADDVFKPSPAADVMDWCTSPTRNGDLPDPWESTIGTNAPGAFVAYYFLVGRDGRARRIAPLVPTSDSVQSKMIPWFHDVRFPILSCAGHPIEYEDVYFPPIAVLHPGETLARPPR